MRFRATRIYKVPPRPSRVEIKVVLEWDDEVRQWVAEAPGIEGAYTQGPSKRKALDNLREVFELLRQVHSIPSQPPIEFARIRVEA